MTLRTMEDGTEYNRAEVICATCLKPLSYDEPPKSVLYWFAFCGPACLAVWNKKHE